MAKHIVFIVLLFRSVISIAQSSSWTELGPFDTPELRSSFSGRQGIGRTSCIRFDTDFQNTGNLYLGSPLGGLWKYIVNVSNEWINLNTDQLPNIGISDFIIDPNNTATFLVATGDPDAPMDFNRTFLGNTAEHSRGIIKSTDGGNTWTTSPIGNWYDESGLLIISNYWEFPTQKKVRRLIYYPGSSNIIFALVETYDRTINLPVSYIYRTDNGGADWFIMQRFNGEKLGDIEFCPNDPNTVYVSGLSVYKSIYGGLYNTWVEHATGLNAGGYVGRTEIAVSNSNSNIVYALSSDQNPSAPLNYLYISMDKGENYTLISQFDKSPVNRTSIAVDQTDENNIYVTSSNFIRRVTYNNGQWNLSIYLQIPHADVHELAFEPNSSTIYASTDGGLAVSVDNGTTWSYMNNGLKITQLWDIDVDQDNANRLAIGTQDNGTILYDIDINNSSNGWAKVMDGDGFVTLIDYSSEKYLFHTDAQVPGSIRRSNDLGITWTGNLRPTGASTDDSRFPLIQHSTMPNIMYTGFQNIFKSYDYGLSWTQITNINASQKVKNIAICESKPEHIYFNYGYTIWRPAPLEGWFWYSPDGGVTWLDRTPGLEGLRGGEIGGIAVDPYNPLRVIVSFKGTVHRMMCSSDGGMTWTDFMQGLPDDADFYGLCTEKGSKNIYAAASNGVYVYNDDVGQWQAFNHLLPRVWVLSTKINYRSNEIFAATHGRGAWKSHLFCPINTDLFLTGIVQSNKIEESIGNLVSEEKIAANQEVTYRSTYEVTLTAGFEAAEGSDFTAFIRDCVTGRSSMRTASELSDEEIGNRTGWKELNLLVAPNPVKESFCIKLDLFSDLNWMKYDVINVSGTVIANGKLGGDVKVVDSSSWNSGIYYIIVYTNVGKVVRKIVKI